MRALIAAYPDSLPRSADVTLDLGVLALHARRRGRQPAWSSGFAPLLHLAPGGDRAALKEGGQRSTGGARNRIRRGLVAAEVALAVALVIGAGLLLRTVMNLTRVDTGFERGQLVTFGISLPRRRSIANGAQILSFYERLIGELRSLPGVTGVAGDVRPAAAARRERQRHAHRRLHARRRAGPATMSTTTRPSRTDYIETMGIPVVEGRAFCATDAIGAPVVLINETMATDVLQGTESHRAARAAVGRPTPPWFTIVGVVKDVKQGGVDQKTGTELYFNFEQLATCRPANTPLDA